MPTLLKIRALILAAAGKLAWLPPLVARVTLGWVFLESGWGKVNNLPKVIDFFRSLGIPAPEIQAPFAAGTELVCGALLLVGLLSRLASLPLVVVMIVAIATAKVEDLHTLSDLFGFSEYLYIALLLWVAVAGPGVLSLDALLARLFAREPAGGAAAPAVRLGDSRA